MDVLARFPRVWCPSCNQTQPMIFDVMKAKDNDAADIVRDEYKGRAPTGLACAPTGPRKHGQWRATKETVGRPLRNRGRTAPPASGGFSGGPKRSRMFAATVLNLNSRP